jgi:hypothetical protein
MIELKIFTKENKSITRRIKVPNLITCEKNIEEYCKEHNLKECQFKIKGFAKFNDNNDISPAPQKVLEGIKGLLGRRK